MAVPVSHPATLCPPSLPLQMDPVQKAVISHTFGVPAPLKKKQFISCNICHLRFNSAVRRAGGRAGPVTVPMAGQEHPIMGTMHTHPWRRQQLIEP